MKIREILSTRVDEYATAGATSAGNIATVNNPQVAIGPDRFKKSYTGYPGKSGWKAPKVPKVATPKHSDGRVKGAHEMPNVSLFGQPIKRV